MSAANWNSHPDIQGRAPLQEACLCAHISVIDKHVGRMRPSYDAVMQAQAALQAAELADKHVATRLQQAERAARVHEAAAEKLRARLAVQVTSEERRCKRNAEAYARAKRAVAANRCKEPCFSASVGNIYDRRFPGRL